MYMCSLCQIEVMSRGGLHKGGKERSENVEDLSMCVGL